MLIICLGTNRDSVQLIIPMILNIHETPPFPVLSDCNRIGGHLTKDGPFIGTLVPYAGLLWPGSRRWATADSSLRNTELGSRESEPPSKMEPKDCKTDLEPGPNAKDHPWAKLRRKLVKRKRRMKQICKEREPGPLERQTETIARDCSLRTWGSRGQGNRVEASKIWAGGSLLLGEAGLGTL